MSRYPASSLARFVVRVALAGVLGCGSTAPDADAPRATPGSNDRAGRPGPESIESDRTATVARPGREARSEPHHARSHWHEIAENTSSSGDAWSIPYCETRSDGDGTALRPAGPSAQAYNALSQKTGRSHTGDPDGAAPGGELATRLGRALHDAANEIAAARGMASLHSDAALAAAARDLARLVPDDYRIPYPMLEFAVRHHGVIEAAPTALVLWGPLFDPPALARQLAAELPAVLGAAPATARYNRVGIASIERGEIGAGVVVLVLAAEYVTTRPFPRALPRGGAFHIEGEFAAPFGAAQVTVIRDNGDRLSPTVVRRGSRGFRVQVGCGSFRGRQRIHLAARVAAADENAADEQPSGTPDSANRAPPRTLASVPVWCHAEPPVSIALSRAGKRARLATVASTREMAIRLASRINAERRRCGLDAIGVDTTIESVTSERPVNAAAARRRLIATGVQTSSVYHFTARTFHIDDVVRELFESFDYRAALLSPRTTHMGLDVVRARAGKGSEYVVTQLFASIPSALTLADVRQAVTARLQRRRDLVLDSELATQAALAARTIAADTSVETVVDQATRDLRRKRTRFATAKIQVWTGADVGDFRLTREADNRKARHFGLGVARAAKDGDRAGEFTVVLILAELKGGTTRSGASLEHP